MTPEIAKKLNTLIQDFKNYEGTITALDIAHLLVEANVKFSGVEAVKAPVPVVKFLLGGCRHPGFCVKCNAQYVAGAQMFWTDGIGCWCPSCGSTEDQTAAGTYWTNYIKQLSKVGETK